MALEYCTLVDHQHRRRQIADDLGGRADFDALSRDDVATDLARDDNRGGLDLRGYDCGLADRQAVLAGNFAINLAVDSSGSVERQFAADLRAAIKICARIRSGR